jgi:hypothetical protein
MAGGVLVLAAAARSEIWLFPSDNSDKNILEK